MSKFQYRVRIAKQVFLESELNNNSIDGFKLYSIKPLNTFVGIELSGMPKVEISYQLIFEREVINEL